ncbi:MAG: hypothetical protein AAF911_10340 [Planctomycetota bacterium]
MTHSLCHRPPLAQPYHASSAVNRDIAAAFISVLGLSAVHALDQALLDAWHHHVLPRLANPAGRAELARRLQACGLQSAGSTSRDSSGVTSRGTSRGRPLRSFTLVLRANDRRIPDHNTVGAVLLDADEVARLCGPVHLPPPGLSRRDTAARLGVAEQSLTARVRAGHLIKHQPHPVGRANRRRGEQPRPSVFYYAPPPHHEVHPVADVQSADWGTLNQHLHLRPRNLPQNSSNPSRGVLAARSTSDTSKGWSQTLHRTVRQLRPHNPTAQYERFEWHCPYCDKLAQRLYWPFRPLTLPAYLGFDFQQLAPELAPEAIAHLKSEIEHQHLPFTEGFTCRRCLQHQFGGQGLTYESTEFTSQNGKNVPKNTWHLFIQRLTLGLMRGDEVDYPD